MTGDDRRGRMGQGRFERGWRFRLASSTTTPAGAGAGPAGFRSPGGVGPALDFGRLQEIQTTCDEPIDSSS